MNGEICWGDLLARPAAGHHIVQLYRSEEFLAEAVGVFAEGGLTCGEAVVLAATRPHATTFRRRLIAQGFDVSRHEARGQLTFLDAQDAADQLERDGLPDDETFEELGRTLVERVRARYPRMRWWSEVTGLLCARGRTHTGLRLEEMFDGLLQRLGFAAFCSLPMDNFSGDTHGEPLQGLCRVHSHLIPVEDYGRLDCAVGRALDELLGPAQVAMVRTLSTAQPPRSAMPESEEILLWMQRNLPATAEAVLQRAREYYDRPSASVIF
ncbi:MAG: MEDS domain-containing protein [Planctomycetes bacterium]|nr:MEDS domain-containing protein [Planctomycetota bacterium]